MYNVATGWLMVSLDANPLTVSMVQVANTLPRFLFAIPAGALVDIIDQRRFLIAGIVSQLVRKPELQSAVAANSVGINISQAVGPAVGGLLVVSFGLGAPFWINAVSNIGVVAALVWWRPPCKPVVPLPAESFTSGVRTGLRHARYNPYLAATLIRTGPAHVEPPQCARASFLRSAVRPA